jgi:hypothetical protein
MDKRGNPNFKNRWHSGVTTTIRIPECFQSILFYVTEKLDKQLINEVDLQRMIDDYIFISIKGLSDNNKPCNDKNVININDFNDNKKANIAIKPSINDFIDSLNDKEKLEVLKKILK